MPDAITLANIADRARRLKIACRACERHGRLSVAKLVAQHGPEFTIPDLLRLLSADCPKARKASYTDPCGIHCPELPRFL